MSPAQQDPFFAARPRLGQDLLSLNSLPHLQVNLKYNGTHNFMGQDLYLGFAEGYLHREAWQMMAQATKLLGQQRPGYSFLVFDALRPRSVQRKMRKFVQGTPMQEFVADPDLGSLHNFGMAIDLTLQNQEGIPLDMGTEFDDFSELAQPQRENELLTKKLLSPAQVANRKLLRSLMESSGFQQLPHEWWHYNAKPAAEVRGHYAIVE